MSVAQLLQNAWQRQSKWLLLLRPLSALYQLGFVLNRSYAQHFKTAYKAPIPVMVIGNITVGGSGKTPLLIALVHYLQARGVRVGVISRGYGGTGPFPCLVAGLTAREVGDEPALIVQATQVPMAVGANRQAAIELLMAHHQLDLILSDDGLQHWALARDIEWIVLDLNRGLGNEKLLPEGFLREPTSRLVHASVIEHASQPRTEYFMQLQLGQPYLLFPSHLQRVQPLQSKNITSSSDIQVHSNPSTQNEDGSAPINIATQQQELHALQTLQNHAQFFDHQQPLHAVVGIGFPARFTQSLQALGILNFQSHVFNDHHCYQQQDLVFNDSASIITTEKDAVKLKALWLDEALAPTIWVLPVSAKLSHACYQLLDQQLSAQGIRLNSEAVL